MTGSFADAGMTASFADAGMTASSTDAAKTTYSSFRTMIRNPGAALDPGVRREDDTC